MPRAIWSGSICFGLLNVPVKLYSAVSKKSVSFRELRESDGSRIRHKRVAEADGEEVAYERHRQGLRDRARAVRGASPATSSRSSTRRRPARSRSRTSSTSTRSTRSTSTTRTTSAPTRAPSGLRAAGQGDGGRAQGRDRALRAPQQGEPRGAAADGRGADDGDDALRRRGRLARRDRRSSIEDDVEKPKKKELDMAKALIDSLAGDFDAEQVPRRVPRGAAGADRAQGEGREDRQRRPPRRRSRPRRPT